MDSGRLKQKAVAGVGVLVLRNFLLQPISFLGFAVLSVFLQAWELGVFWAVSEVVAILSYFSDIGLAAALVQKKEKPSLAELRTIFTFQQLLVGGLILFCLLALPWLEGWFHFGREGRLLFYALLFGFFAASLKTVSSVLLERRLEFTRLAIVDLVEQVVFTGLAVVLAWQGFGIKSWLAAVVGRAIVGVVLIFVFAPWRVGFDFHFVTLKQLVRFGIPFQANSLLAVAKDRLSNVFLWKILGSGGMGVLGWAQRWAQLPLRFLLDPVIRVSFPAYSRLQSKRQKLKQALERTIFLIAFFIFPLLAGEGILLPQLVEVYPRYQKWRLGILPFWFYLGNFAFGAVTTPLTNAFNAVGQVGLTLRLMVFWTVLTWGVLPLFASFLGVNGAALALFLVSSSSFVVWWLAKREFGVSVVKSCLKPFLGSTGMVAGLWLLLKLVPVNFWSIAFLVVAGGVIYLFLLAVLAAGELSWLLGTVRELLSFFTLKSA